MISTHRLTASARAGPEKPVEAAVAPATTFPRTRIAWMDHARGLSILMVVVGHVLTGLTTRGLLEDGPALRIWDPRYYNIRMPFFFVLSGLFAERWAGRRVGEFLRDKGATIVYPFFVWATLQALVKVALNPVTQGDLTLWNVVTQPIFPDDQFWFLHVLFFLMLGYFLLRKLGLGPTGCLLVALGCYAIQGEHPQEALSPWARLPYYAPFYAVGGIGGALVSRIRIDRAAHLGAIALVGFGSLWLAVLSEVEPPLPIQLTTSLVGIAGAIAFTALLSRVRFTGFLPYFSRYSLEIFVAHMAAVTGMRLALQKGFLIESAAVHLTLGVFAGIACPLLLVWICNRLGLRYVFRLPKPAGRRDALAPPLAEKPAISGRFASWRAGGVSPLSGG